MAASERMAKFYETNISSAPETEPNINLWSFVFGCLLTLTYTRRINRLVAQNYSVEQEEAPGMEREIDVWSFDSKSCVKCGVLTYYHTVHVYFKAAV